MSVADTTFWQRVFTVLIIQKLSTEPSDGDGSVPPIASLLTFLFEHESDYRPQALKTAFVPTVTAHKPHTIEFHRPTDVFTKNPCGLPYLPPILFAWLQKKKKPMVRVHILLPPEHVKLAQWVADQLEFETLSAYMRRRMVAAIDADAAKVGG